jgi:hypothetical protein
LIVPNWFNDNNEKFITTKSIGNNQCTIGNLDYEQELSKQNDHEFNSNVSPSKIKRVKTLQDDLETKIINNEQILPYSNSYGGPDEKSQYPKSLKKKAWKFAHKAVKNR